WRFRFQNLFRFNDGVSSRFCIIRGLSRSVLQSAIKGELIRKLAGVCLYVCAVVQLSAAGTAVPVPITASGTGFVSVALIDSNNVLVRTLAYAEPVVSGARTFFWDGTTDLGLPANPGTYTTRG